MLTQKRAQPQTHAFQHFFRSSASTRRRPLPAPQALYRNDADRRREDGEANQNSDDKPNVILDHSASPQNAALYPSFIISTMRCCVAFYTHFHFQVNISERFGRARFFANQRLRPFLEELHHRAPHLLTQRMPRSIALPKSLIDWSR
jgi:hypothetical protein